MPVKIAYKTALFVLGWIFVVLGFIGALLPIVPTTPFLLLAAFCFSKSSPKVHSWLTSIPYCGDAIIDWDNNRVIKPRAKAGAVFMIVATFSSTIIFTKIHMALKIMLVAIATWCIWFIVTRKSRT